MYKCLFDVVLDLEKKGQLIRIKEEVNPDLEMAQIHREVFNRKGPALFFEKVKGSPFPAVSNIFGTKERTEYLFQNQIANVQNLIQWKSNPELALKKPSAWWGALKTALFALPKKVKESEVSWGETTLDQLPQIKCWPKDGGAFVLLPQVYAEDVDNPGWKNSNIGMYRIQLSGNEYRPDEIGLHYQLHRGIGVLHKKALEKGKPFKVSIFVGGPPAHTFAAVMPLPEGLSETQFAGMLGGRRFRYEVKDGYTVSSEADFCIVGTVVPDQLKPEGPFGDHLGYYSLTHEFPFMKVEKVYHRQNAVWPFTVVQRPPAEDSYFGWLVHKLTDGAVSNEIPGVKELHAVDIAGVHPLLLAKGSERYLPYLPKAPREMLTQANAILGFGQCSLAKYLILIEDENNAPNLNDLPRVFEYTLERIQLDRDLHYQTKTTIDTLDYSGESINEGSKLVLIAIGEPVRTLGEKIEEGLAKKVRVFQKGILLVEMEPWEKEKIEEQKEEVIKRIEKINHENFPLVVMVDSIDKIEEDADYFYWSVFTRSNPSHDVYGKNEKFIHKHWTCEQLIIDARAKKHHAPELIEDEAVKTKVQEMLKKYEL